MPTAAGDGTFAAVKAEMLPFDRSFVRRRTKLEASTARICDLWISPDWRRAGNGRDAIRIREPGALLATTRWATESVFHDTESRGNHRRKDFPAADPGRSGRSDRRAHRSPWISSETRNKAEHAS